MTTLRLSDEEHEMLNAVAQHQGLSVADWIRMTARQAFRKLFPEAKAAPRKKVPRG